MMKSTEEELLGNFESKCRIIHQELESKRHKGIIYHYTDYYALANILETRRLRYTDYRFFNDPTEIKFGQDLIKKVIEDSGLPNMQRLMMVINSVYDVFNNGCNMYVSCYSSTAEKLALWRYYANDGCGFAIGFNNKYQKTEEVDNALGQRFISQVQYGENAIPLINQFLNEYRNILSTVERDGAFLMRLDGRLIAQLLSILPILKDASFEDEDEIRLYCMEGNLFIVPETNQPFEFPDEMREFVLIKNKHIPFVNSLTGHKPVLCPEQFDQCAVSEIWIGPCCEFKEARKEVRKLLLQFGYSGVEIRQAPLPYRSS